jgi:hypothetical protein
MSILAPKIYTALSNGAALAAMVSTRIYPVIAPQDVTDPYVTYQRVSGERVIDFGGASNLEQPHYQVSGYADDYLESQNMAEPIIVAMMAATGFSVTSISFLPDEEENAMYSVSLDFGISHDLT